MRAKQLLILAAAVVAVGAFIYFWEREQPTTEERRAEGDKVLAGVDRDDVVGLDIANSHGRFQLARQDGKWALTAPLATPADEGRVSSVLGSLVDLRRQRTLAAGEVDPAAYGLDRPGVTVTLTLASGARHELEVGDETPLGGQRAVSLGGPEVILCPGWFARDLEEGLDGWRSRRVVEAFADQLASFTLESGPERTDRVNAVRVGDGWKLLEPLADVADRDLLRNVIADLNALKVQEFLEGEQDLVGLGLAPPRYRVTLVGDEGAEPTVLELGASREVGGQTRVACRRNGRELLWVDDRAMTGLGKAPVLWRSPLVAPFESWDVEKLTLTDGAATVALERADGTWRLADGAEADGSAVLDRLSALARLRATAFDLVETGGGEWGRATLELGGSDEGAERTRLELVFLRPLAAGGQALVRSSDRATVMAVEAGEVEGILGTLDALRLAPTPAATAAPEP